MREHVLAGTSVATTVASFPLATVNTWLTMLSLIVAIVSGSVSLYIALKRKR